MLLHCVEECVLSMCRNYLLKEIIFFILLEKTHIRSSVSYKSKIKPGFVGKDANASRVRHFHYSLPGLIVNRVYLVH